MAFTTVDNPELYFQAKTYSGNGGTQSITLDGSENMQPDWVWLKKRNGSANHHLVDSVRGAGRYVFSNLTNAEGGDGTGLLTSFNSDGFTLDTGADSNASGATGVGWCWKAGTSFSNDASATGIGSIDSSGSVLTDAGFSIISYTGTGSNATVAHGLGSIPQVYILKNRSSSAGWTSYFEPLGNTKFLQLDTNSAAGTATEAFNNTSPTSSVFSIGTDTSTNNNTDNFIAYCFAEKKGYSKFGSYTGNGNADGAFVYTGFRPAWFLVKNSAASEHWRIYDNKRDSFNHMFRCLFPNENSAENTTDNASEEIDFLSNGVKIRSSAQQLNGSGHTLVFMAFAESPFVNSSGVPNNGR